MKCPNTQTCPDVDLILAERQGVEIDYCPKCRGVWLDRGELDKLMDRAAAQAPSALRAPAHPVAHAGRHPDFDDSDFGQHRHGSPRRKKSWLSEIFD